METTSTAGPSNLTDRIRRLLHVLIEGRSYLNALYLLTAFPLGLTYFVVVLGGAVFGAFLSIVLVGLLVLLTVVIAAWGFAVFERELSIAFLGVNIAPLSLPSQDVLSPRQLLVRHLREQSTWRSLIYLLLKLPFGVFATAVTVALIGPAVMGILYPTFHLLRDGPTPDSMQLILFPGLAAMVGLAIAFHILNAIGRLWGRFATDMLGVSEEQRQVWEARRRAETADRSRRELIVNVSHELRTPVATIQAHIDSLLLADKDKPSPEEAERRLRVTATETRRLADLIEDLLMLARADSDELKVTTRAVALAPVVDQVVQALAPLAREQRQVTLSQEGGAEDLWALADPDRLNQVLTNLVRNAINYTPEGGVVSIRLGASGPDHVQIAVSDTGVGISARDLEHIFERFYRADSSRTRNTGGFGLGLSIARELVEAMGGSLSATSQPGLGSTFWVSLRRTEPR